MYASYDSAWCVKVEWCRAVDAESENVSVSGSYVGGSANDGVVDAT